MLSLWLFLTVASGLLIAMVLTFTSEQAAGNLLWLGLIGLLMLPLVAALGGLMWFLDHQRSKRLAAANVLLRECSPQAMRLNPIEKAGRDGVLATLNASDQAAVPIAAVYLLINPTIRWSAPPQHEVDIKLYYRMLQAGQEAVALAQNGTTFIGKLVERSVYKRQQQWVRMSATVLLAVIAVAWALSIVT